MLRRISLVLGLASLALLAGCVTGPRLSEDPGKTLATSRFLPASEIEKMVSDEFWTFIKDRPYDSYYTFSGPIDDAGNWKPSSLYSYFPDQKDLPIAERLIRRMRVPPMSVGSHITPSARGTVILYRLPENQIIAISLARLDQSSMRPRGQSIFIRIMGGTVRSAEDLDTVSDAPAGAF